MSSHDDDSMRPDENMIDGEHLGDQYERLSAVVSDYRTASELPPDPESRVKERIMDIVRQESLRGPSTELLTPNKRNYQVTTAAIRSEIREVIDAFGGLRARGVSIHEASPELAQFTVEASMTMAPGLAVHRMLPDIRRGIAGRLKSVFGIEVSSIDVRVEDIHHD